MKHILFLLLCLLPSLTMTAQTQSKANELFLKAQELDGKKNYTEALQFYEQAKVEIVKENCKDSIIYANCWTNIGRCYFVQENYKKAAEAFEVSMPRYEKYGDRWLKVVEWLAFCYNELGDQKNIVRMMAVIEDNNQHEMTLPCDEPKCMTERAEYYLSKGENAKSKEHFLKALEMLDKSRNDSKAYLEQKVTTYSKYAKFLGSNMKDYAGGADNYFVAANTQKAIDGVSEEYANLMFTAGIYSYLGKKYQQAVDAYENVIAFYARIDSDAAKNNMAKCYKNMGNAYSAMKNYDKAIACYQKDLGRQEEIGQPSVDYAKALERVATAEKFSKQYDKAVEHYKLSIAMYKQLGKTEEASGIASSLNMCYIYMGSDERVEASDEQTLAARRKKLTDIIEQETSNLEIIKKYLGDLQYASSLATIAGSYYMLEAYAKAVEYYEQYMQSVRQAISKEFSMDGEEERMLIWEEQKKNLEEILDMMMLMPTGNEALMPRISALVYDVELLSKGILLKSSIEFEKVLKNIGDESLLADYKKVKDNNAKLNQLRASAASDADMEIILVLTRENDKLLQSVMSRCAQVDDYTSYLSYSWLDVQKKLKKTDVAIEFVSTSAEIFDQDNYMVAIVLTTDMKHPVAFPVCDIQEAKFMQQDSLLFETPLAGNSVWGGELKKYIDGKKRIFFSADGAFNHTAIEYLTYGDKPLSEQLEVYRLSSTKELCYISKSSKMEKIALFGNIDYYEEATKSEAAAKALRTMTKKSDIKRGADNGKYPSLDNTKEEIEEIKKCLKASSKRDVAVVTGTDASESAFLNLDGSNVNILHIATHGVSDESAKMSDATSMQKCALVFAGANYYDETDSKDGLVSAAEISKMNLRDCDLAVLSACESGRGKLSGDGVFGLQRGFKNAGVHSLLMTLKSVYDVSTAKLMVEFYKGLATGLTKRESLVRAQQTLRAMPEYKKGEHWAPFILLDAYELAK